LARKILLADDSVTAQNMGRRILSDAGYDVTTVNNGSAALKKIAESKPDLIVLDVYMPGYGGLEVCQRLREAPETARIPVLLTVGKLEPFKAEEARRVRADGFIVKPFEASELLTALTKLEDKIVPQSQPAKLSRFAKALAGADELESPSEFDNSETGWKNRLSIPPPHSKPRGIAPEESTATAKVREASRAEEYKPAEMRSGLEEALLSSMPQDVTPEEIAAIKAAAAALNTPSDESSFKQQPARDQAETAAPDPVTAEEPARESEGIFLVPQEAVTANTDPTTTAQGISAGEGPIETVPLSGMVASETDQPQVTGTEATNLGDDEVTAALAALAPGNGHGDRAAIDTEADRSEFGSRDRVPVTMAVAGATEEYSGPRWIAELVPVGEDEATLVLEQEMEKAYAAFAAADAGRMSFASSPEPDALPVADPPAFVAEVPYSPVESFTNADSSESQPQEPAAVAIVGEESIAQSSTEIVPPTVDAVSETAISGESATSEVKELAAYAAAASASSSSVEATSHSEVTSSPSLVVESPESVSPASESSGRHVESELATAWANWKQIRDSVNQPQVSEPQANSQITDPVAEFNESSTAAPQESQPDASSATEEESSEISNIVDSVLADLKPKLMAEIAKKMGKEKKK
jgi:CheY-like chemotaxis protein